MKRRSFVVAATASPVLAMVPPSSPRANPTGAGTTGPWRSFEMTMAVNLGADSGRTRVWLPLPHDTVWQRLESVTWSGNAPVLGIFKDTVSDVRAFHAAWSEGGDARTVTLTTRISTLNRRIDPGASAAGAIPEDVAKFLKPNAMITTDGIVKETADKIAGGKRNPLDKAQAIYDWIVENTFRDPKVKGCGIGDIRAMLVSGNLGGKCADLNALFVGLCRAVGLPARDLYGIRLGESREFRSLGRTGGDMTTAQHCRAEVYIDGVGWMPADPADVRKVMLEEQPGSPETSAHARRARDLLFGLWEMNWIAFNDAHDVELPGSSRKRLPFLMYPQAEVDGTRRDSLDPARFQYQITARE
jgi:hypothetical protein